MATSLSDQPPPDKQDQPLPDKQDQPPPDKQDKPPPDKQDQPLPDKQDQPPPDKQDQPPPDKQNQPLPDKQDQPPPDKQDQPLPDKQDQPPPDKQNQPLPDKQDQPPPDKQDQPPPDKQDQPPPDKQDQPPPDKQDQPPPDKQDQPPPDKQDQPPPDKQDQPLPNKQDQPPPDTVDRILATIYGQCIGDAIGLLTEFLTKREASLYYGTVVKELEYYHKVIVCDGHRSRWKDGDWTDDSDQMILIMRSLVECDGKVNPVDFAKKLKVWIREGFKELGDHAGLGLGKTTDAVTSHPDYLTDPHKASEFVWEDNNRQIAPNGGVMRTSFVGIHMYWSLDDVAKNARDFAKTTHFDPRCQASTVAVSVAIAIMIQGKNEYKDKKGYYKVKNIIKEAYKYASECLGTDAEKKDLKFYLECDKIKQLKLDEPGKIGYTYKSMGSGFWALKQNDFRKAIIKIMFQGGDADSNACVGGALLGCKLGLTSLPEPWLTKLLHRDWLDEEIKKYFEMMKWDWKS